MKQHHPTNVSITKASGEIVNFSKKKLHDSLKRAGASHEIINNVIEGLEAHLYSGISTKKIYKIAFRLLKQNSKPIAARYHLKRGLMELGPSGFPFEKYIEKIFQHQRYTTISEKILQGKCVFHEIDVIAEKENIRYLIECKYHNQPGTVCDVKVPLYIHSRFKDVEEYWNSHKKNPNKPQLKGMVITNTRFTIDAIKYGCCAGLELKGWNFPEKDNLRDMIDALKLYPITCLTSITHHEKQILLNKHLVLCRDLLNNLEILMSIGINEKRGIAITNECKHLCIE